MSDISSNNKRIAKNTMMLYIRMLLNVVVSLYTSRVVLQVLGVEDYGVYGVVGGIVSMFSFLNSSMAGATSRFLTFEMGKGDKERLRDTFSSALMIHISIALFVLILAGTIGVWFLNNKLVIPEGRMEAAHWVLQFSVLGMIVGFTQVPYNATIIAHEKMDVYAYVELIHVFLKLGIVYLLTIGNFDKLIFYALLVLVVNIIVAMTYRIYCIKHYEECKFRWVWDKEIFYPMLSFSGFTLYFSMCFAIRGQGVKFLLNIFFGVITNAASNIATVLNDVLSGFAYNIVTAFRPSIIKYYASNNLNEMQNAMKNCISFSALFFIMIAVPFYLEAPFIIQLWLGEVPQYVVTFVRITIITNGIGVINSGLRIGINATGNIKLHSFMEGSFAIISILITFLLFKNGFDAKYAYITHSFIFALILTSNIFILRRQIKEIEIHQIVLEILKILLIATISILISTIPCTYMQLNIYRVICVIICNIFTIGISTYTFALNKDQRKSINQLIVKIFKQFYNKVKH